MEKKLAYIILIILLGYNSILKSQQRFPKPEFESGYIYPEYQVTEPRNPVLEYMDVFVLVLVLSITTHITLKPFTHLFLHIRLHKTNNRILAKTLTNAISPTYAYPNSTPQHPQKN